MFVVFVWYRRAFADFDNRRIERNSIKTTPRTCHVTSAKRYDPPGFPISRRGLPSAVPRCPRLSVGTTSDIVVARYRETPGPVATRTFRHITAAPAKRTRTRAREQYGNGRTDHGHQRATFQKQPEVILSRISLFVYNACARARRRIDQGVLAVGRKISGR